MGRNRRTGGRRGEKGGGGGVESGPPVVTGRPGLMSKANMMLTFLQGSAVWTARGPRGPSGLQGPPSLGIMHMNGPPHEYHPILPARPGPRLSAQSHMTRGAVSPTDSPTSADSFLSQHQSSTAGEEDEVTRLHSEITRLWELLSSERRCKLCEAGSDKFFFIQVVFKIRRAAALLVYLITLL